MRFPHVFEPTGGQQHDWDKKQFDGWGLRLTEEAIGLIVEVKSGEWRPSELEEHLADRAWRVPYAIKRLGMFSELVAQDVANALSNKHVERVGQFAIAKLLVGTSNFDSESWLHLSLDDATKFISGRMKKYEKRKLSDRLFFDGDLIQFLAWRGGRKL